MITSGIACATHEFVKVRQENPRILSKSKIVRNVRARTIVYHYNILMRTKLLVETTYTKLVKPIYPQTKLTVIIDLTLSEKRSFLSDPRSNSDATKKHDNNAPNYWDCKSHK